MIPVASTVKELTPAVVAAAEWGQMVDNMATVYMIVDTTARRKHTLSDIYFKILYM